MQTIPVQKPFLCHDDRKAQKLKERILKIMAARAQAQRPAVPKTA
jgi:hypothetical protein